MTTHTLADGTTIPAHYDFNQHFEPLVVKNQGQAGICWWETHCTMLEAFARMYSDKAPTFDPHQLGKEEHGWQDTDWSDERFDPARPIGTTHYIGGDKVTHLDGYKDLPPKEAIIKALRTNGVLEGGTFAQHSFERLWQKPWKYEDAWGDKVGKIVRLPVLNVLPGDLRALQMNNWAHDIIYVGYHFEKGVLFQNSWGARFGFKGRAYMGWDMIEAGVSQPGFLFTFNDNPADGLKMPPKLAA